nr:SRPBCC domain-containing protein [Mucilaginibacter sp. L294]
MANKQTEISKDLPNKKLNVVREFEAPVADVWEAWTDADTLDQWWAPRPWKAQTKSMDFRDGGRWIYSMNGPQGERSWCRVDFNNIIAGNSFGAAVSFCDEDGNKDASFPEMNWVATFNAIGDDTKVEVAITFPTTADMEKIVGMGFSEGFTMAHGNLDELLAK